MAKKLFVGGMLREFTELTLRDYFSKFGELEECLIIYDKDTTYSKGFGFVTFAESSMAERALAQQHHVILGRKVDVKSATPRRQHERSQENVMVNYLPHDFGAMNIQPRVKKIFVGGLPETLTTTEFKEYFESYGRIEDVVVMHNGEGKPRGFGFITFDSDEVVENVMQQRYHDLKNKQVEVKRARPREKMVYNSTSSYIYPILNSYNCYDAGLMASQESWNPNWGSFGYHTYYPPQFPSYNPYNYGTPLTSYWNRQMPNQASPMFLTTSNSNPIPTFSGTRTNAFDHKSPNLNGNDSILESSKKINRNANTDEIIIANADIETAQIDKNDIASVECSASNCDKETLSLITDASG